MDNLGFDDSEVYLTKYTRNQVQVSFTNLTPSYEHKKKENGEITDKQKNTSKVSILKILVPILLILFVKIFPQWFDTFSDIVWMRKLAQFDSHGRNFSVTLYQDFIWVTEDCTDGSVQWFDDKWINKTIDWKTYLSATTDNKCSSFSEADMAMIEYGEK